MFQGGCKLAVEGVGRFQLGLPPFSIRIEDVGAFGMHEVFDRSPDPVVDGQQLRDDAVRHIISSDPEKKPRHFQRYFFSAATTNNHG